MANEKTFEILKEMKADPKAKELYEGMEKTNSPEEMVAALAQIAGKLGYDITAEDIKEAMEQEDARRKAQTDKAMADMVALEDDDLEYVAGGKGHPECENDFEWGYRCDLNDWCYFDSNYYGCPYDWYDK